MTFRTRYNARVPSAGTTFTDPSLTLQSEYPETTIDYYLKRYSATGMLGDPTRAAGAQYLDVSEVGDFQAMQEKVLAVKNAFMDLPAEERRQFGDDPSAWVEAKIAEAAQAAQAAQAEQAAKAEKVEAVVETPADKGN
jgi:hypothetical protein